MAYFYEDQDHLHPQVDLFNDSPVAPSPSSCSLFLISVLGLYGFTFFSIVGMETEIEGGCIVDIMVRSQRRGQSQIATDPSLLCKCLNMQKPTSCPPTCIHCNNMLYY